MTIDGITFSSHPCAPGWYASAIRSRDAGPVEADALRIQPSTVQKGYFAICGLLERESGYRVFLAPSNDIVGVARVFGVGSHRTDYDPDAHARALREIAAVE